MRQSHLSHTDTVNLGAYYTPETIVDLTYSILQNHINIKNYTIADTSCGYGCFLNKQAKRLIGADIDGQAIIKAIIAVKDIKNIDFICQNSLLNVSRKNLMIHDRERVAIIGNPPYNDTTSLINRNIKDNHIGIDKDIKKRDLCMSFLLSYGKLNADYVCVLHPLSHLIKRANFAQLSGFKYKLIDGLIISSSEFTAGKIPFPILIALYKKDSKGMDYEYIRNYKFKVKDGKAFRLKDYQTISSYVSKYPNKDKNNAVARFWTIRDINAVKRNKTFIDRDTANTIYIKRDKLHYYCYIDIFKQYADKLPYYFGNCDVVINNDEFLKIKDCFISESVRTNKILRSYFSFSEIPDCRIKINNYFKNLIE